MKKSYALFAGLLITGFAYAQNKYTEPVKILNGHTNDVNLVTLTAKGDRFATGSWDKNINVYDSSFNLLKTLSGHLFPITALRYRLDGKLLASGSSDNLIVIWDSLWRKSKTFEGHKDQVNALLFDRSNRYLFSGSDDRTFMAWDIASGKPFRNVNVGQSVNCLAQQSNDPRFLYVAAGSQVTVYSLVNSKPAKTFTGHADVVNAMAISFNNRLLLTGSNDKTARIWDVVTGKQIRALPVNCWKVTAVAFSDDAKYAVTGCNDGTIKVWEVETGKLITEIESNEAAVEDVLFTKNMTQIMAATMLRESTNYGLRIWPSGIEPPATKIVTNAKDSLKTKRPPVPKAALPVKPNK